MSSRPPEPDDATLADPLAFELAERGRRRRTAAIIAALVATPLGWLGVREARWQMLKRDARLSQAQRVELAALLDGREAQAQGRVASWNEASSPAALASLRLGSGACAVTLEPPSQFSAGAYVKYATHDQHFGAWGLCVLRPGGSCAREYQAAPALTALRERLAVGDVYSWDLEEATAAQPEPEPPRAMVVVDAELPAKVDATAGGHFTFSPGTLSGRTYLYSPEQRRFICGGQVSVRNSKKVDIEYSDFGSDPSQQVAHAGEEGRAALERDFEVQLRFGVPPGLRQLAVDP